MKKYKVAVTDDRHGTYQVEKAILGSINADLEIFNCNTAEEVLKVCRDADGILVNLAPMPADVINQLEKCRVIARYGVGFDNVDVNACSQKGIYLTNVTDYCSEEVSDQALALLMACARKIVRRHTLVRQGRWNEEKEKAIYRMFGKTFTFLGFGMIARCLLRKIKGMDFGKILVYDPYVDDVTISSYGVEKVDWRTALENGDYISIHLPLNGETKGLINKSAFDLIKNDAILINTSRGAVIDEPALIDALQTGKINSAGLDVLAKEPLEKDNPLLKLDNCIITDHIGWYSEESVLELKKKAAENVRDVLLGKEPRYPVNSIIS